MRIQLAKIRQHRYKEHLEISRDGKFKNDLLETNEDIHVASQITMGANSYRPPHHKKLLHNFATLWSNRLI